MCAKTPKRDLDSHRPLLPEPKKSYGSMGKSESQNNSKFVKLEKPDGGWGWLVVLGVAVSNMCTQSLLSTFSLLFIQRLTDLNIQTSGAAIIVSFQTTILNFSGFFTGPVLKTLSPRQVAMIGGVFFAVGLGLTIFADSMYHLILTYSLFTGVGLGLLQPSTFVAVNSYFSTRRGRAVGLAVAGTGIGQMLLPQAVRIFLDLYGFQGTVLIIMALSLNSITGACLYQPVRWHMKKKLMSQREVEECEELIKVSNQKPLNQEIKQEVPGLQELKKETIHEEVPIPQEQTKEKPKSKSLGRKIIEIMDLSLLGDVSFLCTVIGLALAYVANVNFNLLYPFLLQSYGFVRADIALCMSVLSGADIVGRILIPTFTDLTKIKNRTSFFVAVALSAVFRSAMVIPHNFTVILIIAAFAGFFRAGLVLNWNLAIAELVPPEKLPAAVGLNMIFKGVAIMTFGPLIGFIRDYTKSFSLCVHVLSIGFLLFPFSLWLLEILVKKVFYKIT